jgi:hypothetical protein
MECVQVGSAGAGVILPGWVFNSATAESEDLRLLCPLIRDNPDDDLQSLLVYVYDGSEGEDVECTLVAYDDNVNQAQSTIWVETSNTGYDNPTVQFIPSVYPYGYTNGRWFLDCTLPDDDEGYSPSAIFSYYLDGE